MLLRFDPFRELDRATTEAFGARAPVVPMDAVRKDDHVEVSFDLPGVDRDSIDLEVERNVLTLRAERRRQVAEGNEVLASERRHGTFTRQLLLGDTLDTSQVEASYDDGVLRVTIPTAEQAKPRRISVGAGTASRSIESSASEAAPESN